MTAVHGAPPSPVHPWRLVAPWWAWKRQAAEGVAKGPRETRPWLQKFDRPDWVDGFLKQPQHSLKFQDDVDRVKKLVAVDAPALGTGAFAGRFSGLFVSKQNGVAKKSSKVSLQPTNVRKLYLDTHRRFYAVVAELHCDVPGFPSADRSEACQAGFVVRRRWMNVPKGAEKEAQKILSEIGALQAELSELEETAPLRPRAEKRRAAKVKKLVEKGDFAAARAALLGKLALQRDALAKWQDASGVVSVEEGWFPSPYPNIGDWRPVADTPADVTEAWYPLFPLGDNPDIPDHDAQGRTLYFGVVPTSSHDTDAAGRARYDDRTLYEIRCFVRRHREGCARLETTPDCKGEVVWSRPAEPYRLAPPFDLLGTSNRPVTIQMPDLKELAAQAAQLPLGKFSPVKVLQPQALKPNLDGTTVKDGSMGGAAICFFAIPLITIVAFFVLNIFLPIVVFLFGLWFLLAFKFCIPPSLSLSVGADLKAEVDALDAQIAAGIEVDATADFNLEVAYSGGVEVKALSSVQAGISGKLGAIYEMETGQPKAKITADLGGTLSPTPLLALGATASSIPSLPTTTEPEPAVGLELTAGLEFEPHVSQEVFVS